MTATTAPMTDPTDVMGKRIAAFLIDTVLLLVLLAAVAYPIWHGNAKTSPTLSEDFAKSACETIKDQDYFCFTSGSDVVFIANDDFNTLKTGVILVSLGYSVVNLLILPTVKGGSIGKLMLGLRVVNGSDGQIAGFGKHAIRWLVGIVDNLCCGIIGLIAALTSSGHRRLGDMAAGTNVVAASQVGRPPTAVIPVAAGGGWATPPTSVPPPGWAPPEGAPPAGWAPTPGAETPGAPTTPPPGGSPTGDGPTWDEARKAYIQYDQARAAWLQFDDATQEWKPIDQ